MSQWKVASPRHIEERVGRSEYRQVSALGSLSPGELERVVAGLNAPNADLIVRAVNAYQPMLDALEGMLEWARRVKERNPGMEIFNATQAIALAKGETPAAS